MNSVGKKFLKKLKGVVSGSKGKKKSKSEEKKTGKVAEAENNEAEQTGEQGKQEQKQKQPLEPGIYHHQPEAAAASSSYATMTLPSYEECAYQGGGDENKDLIDKLFGPPYDKFASIRMH
ncbi:hypothetical protein Ancab_020922 [Ancistrocladus abbreviatus]